MLQIKKVVAPVDFSPMASRALEHAALLARWYDAELVALHVVPLLPTVFGFPSPAGYEPAVNDAVVRELARAAEAVASIREATPVVREGSPPVEILHFAAEAGAGLLVLGTHGRTGFERLMLGSVTEKVLRKAPCPVLTVPPRAGGRPERPVFQRILCGVDFSDSGGRALEYALSLAQEAGAQLTLAHVLDTAPDRHLAEFVHFDAAAYRRHVARDRRDRLEALFPDSARDWCRPETKVAWGKPYVELLRLAEEDHSDLVVLGVRGSGPRVDRMLFGSTTQHVVRQAACPVLTVHD